MDLGERALRRALAALEALAARGDQPQHDGDRLVVGEHERREPEAGADAVAAADAPLALDGDVHVLERRDVAPHRPAVDLEELCDLAPGRERPGLEKLQELEEAGRGRLHGIE